MGKTMRTGVRVAFCLLFAVVSACARTPPEARLRETVSGLQAAVEGRDVGALREVLAEDFVGPDGLDREGARRLAQGTFLRYRDVGVTIGPLDVDLHAQQATVRFTAALTAGGAGALPESGQVYDVETGWREVDGDWRLVNASWKPRL
jgi:hypothetical protein